MISGSDTPIGFCNVDASLVQLKMILVEENCSFSGLKHSASVFRDIKFLFCPPFSSSDMKYNDEAHAVQKGLQQH